MVGPLNGQHLSTFKTRCLRPMLCNSSQVVFGPEPLILDMALPKALRARSKDAGVQSWFMSRTDIALARLAQA